MSSKVFLKEVYLEHGCDDCEYIGSVPGIYITQQNRHTIVLVCNNWVFFISFLQISPIGSIREMQTVYKQIDDALLHTSVQEGFVRMCYTF